jgi:hypothetical protein
MTIRTRATIACTALVAAACATPNSVHDEPLDEGYSRHYAAPFSHVVGAASAAIPEAGFSLEKTERPDSATVLLIGHKGMNLVSAGSYVRVMVLASDSSVTVRVLTKKAVATNFMARGNYSGTLFSLIDKELGVTGSP